MKFHLTIDYPLMFTFSIVCLNVTPRCFKIRKINERLKSIIYVLRGARCVSCLCQMLKMSKTVIITFTLAKGF